jgi:hypothetical protein
MSLSYEEFAKTVVFQSIKQWKNNCFLTVYDDNYQLLQFQSDLKMCFVNEVNMVILPGFTLPSAKMTLGVVTAPEDNLIIVVRLNDCCGNKRIGLFFDFYEVSEDLLTISRLKRRRFRLYHRAIRSFSAAMGKLTNNCPKGWTVLLGDWTNCDYFCVLQFDKMKFGHMQSIPTKFHPDSIMESYFVEKECMIFSEIYAYDLRFVIVRIKSLDTDDLYFSAIYEVPSVTHRFDTATIVDSKLLELKFCKDGLVGLIRVKLEKKLDPLHLEYYYIDILVDMMRKKVLKSSKKIPVIDFESMPSAIKEGENVEDLPTIWDRYLPTRKFEKGGIFSHINLLSKY